MAINISKEKIINLIENIIKKNNLDLYELNFNYEFENDIIQVLLENKNSGSVSFDELEKINEEISSCLDEIKELDNKYILEVSSAGIERQIKTEMQLKSIESAYVYVEYLKENNILDFTGEYVGELDGKFNFKFFNKGQPKKISLKWNEIKFIRHAVNFKNI